MKISKSKIIVAVIAAIMLLPISQIQAQSSVTAADVISEMETTAESTMNLIKIIFGVVMLLGGVFIGYAFFTGNPKARDMVIGYLVVLILYGITVTYF